MNGDVFIFIYTSRGIYLFSRSLVERSVFETPSRRNLRGFIYAVFLPLVLLRAFCYYCFMFSLSRVDTVLLFLSVQSRRFLESSFLLTFYESLNVTGVEGIDKR